MKQFSLLMLKYLYFFTLNTNCALVVALLLEGLMMLVIAEQYVSQQYKSFYLIIIDLIFYFVFNSQFNDMIFQSLELTENDNENDNSVQLIKLFNAKWLNM